MEEKDFFITTWRTSTANETITIPTTGAGYNYNVSWGDGKDETGFTGDATHQYEKAGVYTVKISGEFPTIYFNERKEEEKTKILTIEQWGTIQWKSFFFSFDGCSNVTLTATDAPDLSKVTDMSGMFSGASLFNGDLNHWDVSSITSLVSTFSLATSFNGNINEWNVANVESMSAMFSKASSFEGDLSSWNVGNVSNMSSMFSEAHKFNSDISGWDVKNVTDMSLMFFDARAFNRKIGGWNVGKVKNMLAMFQEAKLYTENYDALLIGWNRQELQSNVLFSGGSSAYCLGEEARENIISKFNWAITDANKDEQCGAIDVNKSLIKASPTNIAADGVSSSTIEVQLLDINGVRITSGGDKVVIVSSLGNLGDVVDNSDGTYTVSLTSNVEGNAELSFTVNGAASMNKTNVSFVEDSESFITTWETTTDNETITIPTWTNGRYKYLYDIDWGDGVIDTGVTGNAIHEYALSGNYKVKIRGEFPAIYFSNHIDKEKILTIEQWGDIQWSTMYLAFADCSNLVMNALDTPDLSLVTDMSGMFRSNASIGGVINTWDVSNVTSMSQTFFSVKSINADIGDWNVSNVTSMSYMFSRTDVSNINFSKWKDKLTNVRHMGHMFNTVDLSNQDLSEWDVSNVSGMEYLFANQKSFNQDLSEWDVSMVTNMSGMFVGNNLSDLDIVRWSTGNVRDMSLMFLRTSLFNLDIGDWDVSNVENMSSMFNGSSSFEGKNLNKWKTGKVKDMSEMFRSASSFNANIDGWDVGNVTNMSYMLAHADLFNGSLREWNVENVIDMSNMFSSSSFNGDLDEWNVEKVENMRSMFSVSKLFNGDLSEWKTSNVKDMEGMFTHASSFNGNISNWDVSNVENMSFMFNNATSFNQDLGSWNVSNVTDMRFLFNGVKLSTENYDSLLIGWNKLDLNENIEFDGGNSTYCLGEEARESIKSKFKWTIKDKGEDEKCGAVDINKSTIVATPTAVEANNTAFSTITVQLLDTSGVKITSGGETVVIKTTLGNLSNITDNLNGTYTATLSSEQEGNAELSFSVNGEESINKANVSFQKDTESFITTWQTTTDNESITIPTKGDGYDYTVDWGDGTVDSAIAGNATHIYEKAGIYTVKIKGDFPRIFFNNQGDKDKILTIEQWGIIEWKFFDFAFMGCSKLVSNTSEVPNLIEVKSLDSSFKGCTAFTGDLSKWDVSSVTSMKAMFQEAASFNSNLNDWDFRGTTNIGDMFRGASSFNGNISDWNVNDVVNMGGTFAGTDVFNQDLSRWQVENVTSMYQTFSSALKFNSNLSEWDVSNVTTTRGMFGGAREFKGDLNQWDTTNVTDMSGMFQSAVSFEQGISNWNVENVKDMSQMFLNATSFNDELGGWNVGNVLNMRAMFSSASKFTSDLSEWDVSNVTNMEKMFGTAFEFTSDLHKWNVSNVTLMREMFSKASSFNGDVSTWDVSNITDMYRMFRETSFDSDISSWDVSNVTDMSEMFKGAGMRTVYFDALLIGWSKQDLKQNVPFDAGYSAYCDGEKAREDIISKFNWSITDAGRDVACVQLDLSKSTITAVPQNVNIDKEESSLITVQLKDEFGNSFTRPTESVSINSTKGVTSAIQNLGNGIYQTELRDQSVGTAIVSFKVGAEKGIQNTLVSFYQPLGCQVPFNIKADQTIARAKGRYRRIYDESIDATIPWVTFEITNFNNPSTPLLREAAEYELEIMIQGVNGVWTDWYKHSSFVINGCDQNQENVLEIYKGNCFSILGGKVKVYLKTGDTSKMYLYKDAGFNIPFNGNNESYVIVSKPVYSEYERRSLVSISTIEFKVREDGEMHGIVPCNSYDS